jgi:hypothetical protein
MKQRIAKYLLRSWAWMLTETRYKNWKSRLIDKLIVWSEGGEV